MGLLSSDADTTYYDNLYSYTKRDSLVALAYYVALLLACYGTGHYLAATNYTVNLSIPVSVVFALIPVVICRHSLSKIGICRNNLKPSLLAACAIGSAYLFLVAILPGIREHRQLLPIARIAYNVFYYFILIGFIEEIQFRGFIQPRLFPLFKREWLTTLMGGILFAFMHIPFQMFARQMSFGELLSEHIIGTMLYSFFFTYLYRRYGNIFCLSVLHGFIDLALGIFR